MTELWSQHFEDASWTGGSPGSGEFDAGDLCSAEIILNLAHARLWNDETLRSVFEKERIEMMEIRNPLEFRDLPRLQCYLGSLSEERVATRLDLQELIVYFGIRFDAFEGFQKLEPGKATAVRVSEAVKRVLKDYKDLRVLQVDSPDLPAESVMARNAHQNGEVSYLLDVDETGQRLALTLEIAWLYSLRTDADTGKLLNQT